MSILYMYICFIPIILIMYSFDMHHIIIHVIVIICALCIYFISIMYLSYNIYYCMFVCMHNVADVKTQATQDENKQHNMLGVRIHFGGWKMSSSGANVASLLPCCSLQWQSSWIAIQKQCKISSPEIGNWLMGASRF